MDLKQYIAESGVKKAEIARTLGVSPALVHQWVEQIRPVAIQHCAALEVATKGAVSRRDLRPNDWQQIWPELVQRWGRRASD